MTQVSVHKLDEGKSTDLSLLNSLNGMMQSIQNRAFQISQQNGSGNGSMDNWLQAERELYQMAQSELSETDREFRIQMSVPGIEAKDLEVSVLGSSIVVTTASSRMQTSGRNTTSISPSESIRFTDFTGKPLFRRLDLGGSGSSGIVGQTSATLENGMLTITIAKAANRSSVASA